MKHDDKGGPFWETTPLSRMSQAQWESLCDGCGQCCLVKIEDEETKELYTTNVVCRLLDIDTCRCKDYANRHARVPSCILIHHDDSQVFDWLPNTCAYKKLDRGEPLEDWHPLVSGDKDSVHVAGISVRDYAQSEEYIHPDQLFEHIIHKP